MHWLIQVHWLQHPWILGKGKKKYGTDPSSRAAVFADLVAMRTQLHRI